jgi:hypothetical protein
MALWNLVSVISLWCRHRDFPSIQQGDRKICSCVTWSAVTRIWARTMRWICSRWHLRFASQEAFRVQGSKYNRLLVQKNVTHHIQMGWGGGGCDNARWIVTDDDLLRQPTASS